MKFPIIIEDKKKIRLKILIGLSVIVIIIEALLFYDENIENYVFNIIAGAQFIIWILGMLYSTYAIKNFKVIGFLEYKNNTFLVKDVLIKKEDIKAIVIKYNSYYGVAVRAAVSQGDNNEVFILTKDRKQYRFKIYLRNKEMLSLLKHFISEIANVGIKIHFYKGNKKIFPKP